MLVIEVLVVPDCPHQAAAQRLVATALSDLCIHDARVSTSVIGNLDAGAARGFGGSPTFLIDGHDPFDAGEAGSALACRLYPTPHGLRGVPELRDLRRALKQVASRNSVAGQDSSSAAYRAR